MPGTSTEQVVDKGIRQKSIHSFHSIHSFTDGSAFCPGGTEACFPRTPRNTGVYTRHPTFVTATSGVLTRLPAKLSKNGMHVYTLSDRRSKTKLRVYTASEVKGLTELISFVIKCLYNCFDIDVHRCIKVDTRHVETVKFHHQRSRGNALHHSLFYRFPRLWEGLPLNVNQFTSGTYIYFSGPPCWIIVSKISEKNF